METPTLCPAGAHDLSGRQEETNELIQSLVPGRWGEVRREGRAWAERSGERNPSGRENCSIKAQGCGRQRNVPERVGRLVWYGIIHTAQCFHQPAVMYPVTTPCVGSRSPIMQMKRLRLREVSGKDNSYRRLSAKYQPRILFASHLIPTGTSQIRHFHCCFADKETEAPRSGSIAEQRT